MKFKELFEDLDPKGRWVTLKNGHKAHISKDGEVETGVFKNVNLKDKNSMKNKLKSLKKS